MALDRYDDGVDGPDEAKHLRGGPRDADAAADRTQLAEPRTRQEYFEALRAADGKPVEASDNQRGQQRHERTRQQRHERIVPAGTR